MIVVDKALQATTTKTIAARATVVKAMTTRATGTAALKIGIMIILATAIPAMTIAATTVALLIAVPPVILAMTVLDAVVRATIAAVVPSGTMVVIAMETITARVMSAKVTQTQGTAAPRQQIPAIQEPTIAINAIVNLLAKTSTILSQVSRLLQSLLNLFRTLGMTTRGLNPTALITGLPQRAALLPPIIGVIRHRLAAARPRRRLRPISTATGPTKTNGFESSGVFSPSFHFPGNFLSAVIDAVYAKLSELL
jgi:hypothetical protein